jgi:hypothetical protein
VVHAIVFHIRRRIIHANVRQAHGLQALDIDWFIFSCIGNVVQIFIIVIVVDIFPVLVVGSGPILVVIVLIVAIIVTAFAFRVVVIH